MDDNVKKFVNLSIYISAIFLLIRCAISFGDIKQLWEDGSLLSVGYSFWGYIGESIGATAIIMAIFNKWAWRWKVVRYFHDVPVFSKKYSGTFISNYDHQRRHGEIFIAQTFLSVSVRLKTEESSSRSIVATLHKTQSVDRLIYTYQNEPRAEIRSRSPIHYGTAILDITNSLILEGNYYTDRNTSGSMKFEAV